MDPGYRATRARFALIVSVLLLVGGFVLVGGALYRVLAGPPLDPQTFTSTFALLGGVLTAITFVMRYWLTDKDDGGSDSGRR